MSSQRWKNRFSSATISVSRGSAGAIRGFAALGPGAGPDGYAVRFRGLAASRGSTQEKRPRMASAISLGASSWM
jgi:hypothetical protein